MAASGEDEDVKLGKMEHSRRFVTMYSIHRLIEFQWKRNGKISESPHEDLIG